MPTIYDNIERKLVDGLKESFRVAYRSDICVGYLNMRGWGSLADLVDQLEGGEGKQCRLLVGMHRTPQEDLSTLYAAAEGHGMDQEQVRQLRDRFKREIRQQLTVGVPTSGQEAALKHFAAQIMAGKVVAKLHLAHPLHAKLYLTYANESNAPLKGYVGSSNLTYSGLRGNGELNVDVLDQDAARKLSKWFEDRWTDRWSIDISDLLQEIVAESWAGNERTPYEVFLKIIYHLSNEARIGLKSYEVPPLFKDKLLSFQASAVSMAARMLDKRGGVMIGDVVGLGKTHTAAALIKLVEQTEYRGSMVICPANLTDMWERFKAEYDLKLTVVSLGGVRSVEDLEHYPRPKLLVLDESHNLRNAEGKRHQAIREYIRRMECKVVLLTATPYNKGFTDIGAQVALFQDEEEDLGLRPNQYIRSLGGEPAFHAEHQIQPQTLAAFMKSTYADDWRDLMTHFLVRRTRSFVKKHSPIDEITGKPYLEFADGSRFSFPERVAKKFTYRFRPSDPDDLYAKLYSSEVQGIINSLQLARYGLGRYTIEKEARGEEKKVIEALSRAGERMIGYARTNLFKRLESSGWAFILTLQRHLLRNHLFAYALQNGLDLPIGTEEREVMDRVLTDKDPEQGTQEAEQAQRPKLTSNFKERAERLYHALDTEANRRKYDWLRAALFKPALRQHLLADVEKLMKVWEMARNWDPAKDRQLNALEKFCTKEHSGDKVLVFTQFADTADYLYRELKERKVKGLAVVTGDRNNPTEQAQRFSPRSNKCPDIAGTALESRVLISTDVLSEGQNLQDAHIIINFDLPWALIRLIQRAGRVDRIGQASDTVHCYSFLPEEGLETIIRLRGRLRDRIVENAEVVGSDEVFFEGDPVNLHDLYAEKAGILDEEGDEQVDLGSWAYQIWSDATKDNPELKKRIEQMPDVVLSTRKLPTHEKDAPPGVAVFARTAQDNDMLVWMNELGQVETQSQQRILEALLCGPDEPGAARIPSHHELVRAAVLHIQENEENTGGGQLGRKTGARYRTYERLKNHFQVNIGTLFENQVLKEAIESVYQYPMRQRAKDLLNRRLREGITDQELAELVVAMHEENQLVNKPEDEQAASAKQPRIICSIGLRKAP